MKRQYSEFALNQECRTWWLNSPTNFRNWGIYVASALLVVGCVLPLHQAHAAESFEVSRIQGRSVEMEASISSLIGRARPLTSRDFDAFRTALSNHGWPKVENVGVDRVESLSRLLLENGAEPLFQEAVLRVMDERVGVDLNPAGYARLVDEIQILNGEHQRYGTVVTVGGDGAVGVPKLPESLAGLRFFRDFYGLPTLEEDLRRIQELLANGQSLHEAAPFPQIAHEFPGYKLPELRQELGRMIEADQSTRRALGQATNEPEREEKRQLIKEIDAKNLVRVREILEKHGFPNVKQVGRDGVSTFFLLVQHADDVLLQRRALNLAGPLVESRQMSRQQYALLTDRVLLGEGEMQLYGTQTELVDGKVVVKPVADPEGLNNRRSTMQMGTIEEYTQLLESRYNRQPK